MVHKMFNPVRMALLLVWILSAAVPAIPAGVPAAARIQPVLMELAQSQPGQMVNVIVQKSAASLKAEQLVAQSGGRVTKDLAIIRGFAAQMPAGAAVGLARTNYVRWVSLDAPVQQSANKFTMWASAVGTVVKNGFTNNANMMSPAGPNAAFGSGGAVKGSFKGFQAEYPPGQVISKVEVALRLYLSSSITATEAPKFTAYLNGKAGAAFPLVPSTVSNCVGGAAKACTQYIDITGTRAWTWGSLSTLEILVDQSLLARGKTIYYDAIGVRITTADGDDGTTPLKMTTSADGTTVNTSVMQNVFPAVVRATNVWNTAPYYKGSGVTVAVIDSGNFRTNGLGTRLIGELNFNTSEHQSTDQYGHGTHVTGIIADDGTASGGQYIGMAPKANIIGLRVADDYGMALESDVVAAMQWVYNNRAAYNIRVVNLSLNSSQYQHYNVSPLDAACEILWFNSVTVVVSAGNNGSATLFPPANDPFVITVGATDDLGTSSTGDDVMASFSAYGKDDLGRVKPDLVAPGRNIIAYLPDVTTLTIPNDHPEGVVSQYYFRMSGTSMAAPVVSGAVALLAEANPSLTPDQIKYRLMATANKSWPGYNATTSGAGYLDIFAAVTGTTTQSANTGLNASTLLSTGSEPITWGSVGWNSVGWNSVGWNSVGWNSVGWNSVGWNSDYWGQ